MPIQKHPTLEGEIVRDGVNTASFAFAEPVDAKIFAPVPQPAPEKDALVANPERKDRVSRVIGSKSKPGKAARRFAMQFVGSEEYRQLLWDRLRNGTLSPAVETALLAYAWGKPRQKIDSQVDTRVSITVQRPW